MWLTIEIDIRGGMGVWLINWLSEKVGEDNCDPSRDEEKQHHELNPKGRREEEKNLNFFKQGWATVKISYNWVGYKWGYKRTGISIFFQKDIHENNIPTEIIFHNGISTCT
jgi:hypothetical protein